MSETEDLWRMAVRALEWMAAMGADTAVGEAPVDWRARGDAGPPMPSAFLAPAGPPRAADSRTTAPAKSANSAKPASAGARAGDERASSVARPSAPSPASPASGDGQSIGTGHETDALEAARQLARDAQSLDALEAALARFDGCPLKKTAKKLCFRRGADTAALMVIGEGPGRDEDASGRPFVGRAGQLLDRMLAAIDESDESVHITNVVYWRPPGNRTPTDLEIMLCQPFLDRQIALVDPKVILLVGGAAAKAMLETKSGIMRTRGTWHERTLGGQPRQVIATLHPAYLLRSPAAKALAWDDLRAVRRALQSG